VLLWELTSGNGEETFSPVTDDLFQLLLKENNDLIAGT